MGYDCHAMQILGDNDRLHVGWHLETISGNIIHLCFELYALMSWSSRSIGNCSPGDGTRGSPELGEP